MEQGESDLQEALLELREETGIHQEDITIDPSFRYERTFEVKKYCAYQWFIFYYRCEITILFCLVVCYFFSHCVSCEENGIHITIEPSFRFAFF